MAETSRSLNLGNAVSDRIDQINSLLFEYFLIFQVDNKVALSAKNSNESAEKSADIEKQKLSQMRSAFKSFFVKQVDEDETNGQSKKNSFLRVKDKIERRGQEFNRSNTRRTSVVLSFHRRLTSRTTRTMPSQQVPPPAVQRATKSCHSHLRVNSSLIATSSPNQRSSQPPQIPSNRTNSSSSPRTTCWVELSESRGH